MLAGIVLSTGGGAVLRPANRVRLRENGTVIYLHAEPSTLWARIRHSRNRPLLQTADPMARLAELYAQRDALYRETADHVVESERGEVMRLARMFETIPVDIRTMADAVPDSRMLEVALAERSVSDPHRRGLLRHAGALLAGRAVRHAVVVTNDTVAAALAGAVAAESRRTAGVHGTGRDDSRTARRTRTGRRCTTC